MTKKYVSTDRSGWTNVKLDGGAVVALPQYLRVEFDTRTANRDHFTILEGVYSGKKASVSAKSASTSWLASPLPTYKSPVFLTFDKSTGVMTTPVGNLKTKTDPTNPISNGSHPIQLPDFPHSLGSSYVSRASKAMTWFYLGIGNAIANNNDRYLHPGRISAGCVTVEAIDKWDVLYDVLILARAPGGRNVGTIEVK